MNIFVNEPDFSLDPLYEKGYTIFQLEPNFAKMLHRLLKKEKYALDTPELYCSQYYEDRYYVNYPDGLKDKYKKYVELMIAPFKKALSVYDWHGEYDLNFLKSGPKYWMDWHSDILDESHLSILTYFTEEEITPEHGGELLISKVKRNGEGSIIKRDIVGEIVPKMGLVVILDNQMPCFQHSVRKINIPYERYLLDITIRRFVDLDINNNEHNIQKMDI